MALFALAGIALPRCADAQTPPAPGTLHPTLHHTVMVGYQGWFRTPGDGSGQNWFHYSDATGKFQPGSLNIDYWPDVSDLTATYPTPFSLPPSGASGPVVPARVMSSYDSSTVLTHFQWMNQYGIDGAFVQRFAQVAILTTPPTPPPVLPSPQQGLDNVLLAAKTAAEKTGRSFAVMYDLTNLAATSIDPATGASVWPMAAVMADWKHLVDDLHVLSSPAYQYHNGKPIIAVYGIGFNDASRPYSLADTLALLTFLNSDPKYGGNCIVAGVPRGWLSVQNTNLFPPEQDATNDAPLATVLAQASIIMPWTPGRFTDLGLARLHAEQYWIPELAWCAQNKNQANNNYEYMPVVFPGFSNYNQSVGMGKPPPFSNADREAGRFLWEQYRLLANAPTTAPCTMVYQAMFDEMDEGTQIFKVSNNPPQGQHLRVYQGTELNGGAFPLPADFYLTLVGTAANAMFHQTSPFPSQIPPLQFADKTVSDAVNNYLLATNAPVYRTADDSYSTNKAQNVYMFLLAAWQPPNWAPTDNLGTRVKLTGVWPERPMTSTDPSAAVTWELPVKAIGPTGTFALMIRYPGDSLQQHATDAVLTVTQGGPPLLTTSVNLEQETQTWNNRGVLELVSGAPCQVVLSSQPQSSPTLTKPLTFFEARLVPQP